MPLRSLRTHFTPWYWHVQHDRRALSLTLLAARPRFLVFGVLCSLIIETRCIMGCPRAQSDMAPRKRRRAEGADYKTAGTNFMGICLT